MTFKEIVEKNCVEILIAFVFMFCVSFFIAAISFDNVVRYKMMIEKTRRIEVIMKLNKYLPLTEVLRLVDHK